MEAFLADLSETMQSQRLWAGPIVGLLVFGESMAVVGMFFPATVIMFTIGSMMATGALDPITILGWSLGGAIAGNALSYSIGRAVGPAAYHHRLMRRYRPAFARGRLFFRRHGFAAVVIGRFLGPVRATVPLVAGVAAMSRWRFQVANILSALLWVIGSFLPSYLAIGGFGSGVPFSPYWMLLLGGVITIFSLIIAIIALTKSLHRKN